jgi:hypothetical protein
MGEPPGVALGPSGFCWDEIVGTGKEDHRPGKQAD